MGGNNTSKLSDQAKNPNVFRHDLDENEGQPGPSGHPGTTGQSGQDGQNVPGSPQNQNHQVRNHIFLVFSILFSVCNKMIIV